MDGIILHKDKVNVSGYNRVYTNKDYYVYNIATGAINLCKGRDIKYMLDNGMQLLNYEEGDFNWIYNFTIINPDLGIYNVSPALYKWVVIVAYNNKVWRLNGVKGIIEAIVIQKNSLLIVTFSADNDRVNLVFTDTVSKDLDEKYVHWDLIGEYKDGQAGAEIVKYCI